MITPTRDQIQTLAQSLMTQRGFCDTTVFHGIIDPRVLELTKENQAQRLAVARADAKGMLTRQAAVAADNAAKVTAKVDQERAALTDQLRSRFMAQPGATEEEFAAMLPQLLADHRRQTMATHLPRNPRYSL
jgi:hypothetical protein